MVELTYPSTGRGAWSTGTGGTLNSDGSAAGIYYREPTGHMAMPGYVAYKVTRAGAPVDVNFFAVYAGVKALQREIGVTDDGLFGPATTARLKTWQTEKRLTPDGVFGPASARAMFIPIAKAVGMHTSASTMVPRLVVGHVTVESGWDPGAVGVSTPHDLGLGQINGDAHPDLSPQFRLSPRLALGFVANFVLDNAEAMLWNERDTIAAYNLGVSGAKGWIQAGRPAVYKGKQIGQYIAAVQAAAD